MCTRSPGGTDPVPVSPRRGRARHRLDGSAFAQQLAAAAAGQLNALGALSAHGAGGADATSLVSDVDAAQLAQRWAALAQWGVERAPLQSALNAQSRRQSATELLGRATLGLAQAETVTQPLAEVRHWKTTTRGHRGRGSSSQICVSPCPAGPHSRRASVHRRRGDPAGGRRGCAHAASRVGRACEQRRH